MCELRLLTSNKRSDDDDDDDNDDDGDTGGESCEAAGRQATGLTAIGSTERGTRRRTDGLVERLSHAADGQGQGQHSGGSDRRQRTAQRTRSTLRTFS